MALTTTEINKLCKTGFGPLAIAPDGSGYAAQFEGKPASVTVDGPAIRVSSTRAVSWPTGERQAEQDLRVQMVLADVALARDELTSVTGDRSASEVEAAVWIDASRSEPIDLASAVRVAVLLADVAASTVNRLYATALQEAEARDAAQAVEAEIEAARRSLEAPAPAATTSATAAASAVPPPAAAPPQPKAPEVWFWVGEPTPLANNGATVATLVPGTWYRITAERDGWVRCDDGQGHDGWVSNAVVHRA
jgi:hypothetical protein